MSFLKNRHVLVAALIAPVLALISYFGISYLYGEKPQMAVEGQSYPLVEKPDCRYESGKCGLKNGDFELEMRIESLGGGRVTLMLKSVFPLEGVKAALVRKGADEQQPESLQQQDADGLLWSLEMNQPDPVSDRIRLVASSQKSFYFGDAATAFSAEASD